MQHRKQRSDSLTAAIDAARIAKEDPVFDWPESIALPETSVERDVVLETFHMIQLSRAPTWWRPWHRDQIAQLALLELQKRKLIALMTQNGTLTRNDKGTITRSPVMDGLSQLQGIITQQLKPLGISASQLERDNQGANIVNARRQHNHPLLASDPDDGMDLLS